MAAKSYQFTKLRPSSERICTELNGQFRSYIAITNRKTFKSKTPNLLILP
jgi:hypothetical protein